MTAISKASNLFHLEWWDFESIKPTCITTSYTEKYKKVGTVCDHRLLKTKGKDSVFQTPQRWKCPSFSEGVWALCKGTESEARLWLPWVPYLRVDCADLCKKYRLQGQNTLPRQAIIGVRNPDMGPSFVSLPPTSGLALCTRPGLMT